MTTSFKGLLAAALMSSVALSTVATFASADAAYAKSDKSNGKSGEARERGSKNKDSKGKSKERSASRGQSGSLDTLFKKLTGQEKRAAKSDNAKVAKGKKTEDGAYHPSELGNMNGAMNANVNAILAHIRNGNGNGPVGHLAVLMAATANAQGDQTTIDLENAYLVIDGGIVTHGSLDGYFESLDAAAAAESIETIDNFLAVYGEGATGTEAETALSEAIAGTAFETSVDPIGDYLTSLDAARNAARDTNLEDALVSTGYNDTDGTFATDRPSEVDPTGYDQAVADLAARDEAEADILAYWNKNPGGEVVEGSAYTAEEEQLLMELRDRFSTAEQDAIRDAVADTNIDSSGYTCDALETDCDPDDDLASL